MPPEERESTTIIERFNERIAELIEENGVNMENILRKLYKKIDIDQIIKEYL